MNGIRDTDKSLWNFFEQCSASTPEECAFWASTPQKHSERLDALYRSIREKPLPVATEWDYGYGIVDYALLRVTIFSALYSPYKTFSNLALGLKDLEAGNGSRMINMARAGEKKLECNCGGDDSSLKPALAELSIAVYCSDAEEYRAEPMELYQKYLEIRKEFGSFADIWIQNSAKCTHVLFPVSKPQFLTNR